MGPALTPQRLPSFVCEAFIFGNAPAAPDNDRQGLHRPAQGEARAAPTHPKSAPQQVRMRVQAPYARGHPRKQMPKQPRLWMAHENGSSDRATVKAGVLPEAPIQQAQSDHRCPWPWQVLELGGGPQGDGLAASSRSLGSQPASQELQAQLAPHQRASDMLPLQVRVACEFYSRELHENSRAHFGPAVTAILHGPLNLEAMPVRLFDGGWPKNRAPRTMCPPSPTQASDRAA